MLFKCTRKLGHKWLWAGALAVGCCLGCADKNAELAPVRGRVLLDGEPLSTGTVLTQPPAGRGSNGAIQRDGTFQLSTYGKGNGARPGSHQVAVVAYEGTGVGPERGEGTLLVPKRYTSPATSGLTIEVKVGEENSPVLELTSE